MNHPDISWANRPTDYDNWTRYQVYRWEIENSAIPDNATTPVGPPGENGNPSCYSGGAGTLTDPIFEDPNDPYDDDGSHTIDRRVFTLAVVNCIAEGPLNGNQDNVPTIGYIDVFLTQPAEGQGNDQADIYGEIIGVTQPGTNGLRDMVQLYR